jgi:HlyD family secretion protein
MSTMTSTPTIDLGPAASTAEVRTAVPPATGLSPETEAAPPEDIPRRAAPAPSTTPARSLQRRSRRRARIILLIVLLLTVTAVTFALRPSPMDVETSTAGVRTLRVSVDADAVTRVRQRFTVTAPLGGLVHRLALHEGDLVRAGDTLASITTQPVHSSERDAASARVDALRAGLLQFDARLAQADLALAQATRDEARARQLNAAGAIADRDVELATLTVVNRRAELGTAQAQRRMALAELSEARSALAAAIGTQGATTVVRAPAPGRVLEIPDRSARVVVAGSPLLELGDPGALEVAADVLSADAASVRVGQPVTLRGWGGAALHGVVRLVEPSARTRVSALGVEEQRLAVVIDLPDVPPALGVGYRLDASIDVWSGRVLAVPASALLRVGETWEVFVVRNGRVQRQPMRVGHVGSGVAEVLGGLRAGDSVVVFPPDALRRGDRVRPAD